MTWQLALSKSATAVALLILDRRVTWQSALGQTATAVALLTVGGRVTWHGWRALQQGGALCVWSVRGCVLDECLERARARATAGLGLATVHHSGRPGTGKQSLPLLPSSSPSIS